jgi:hypothetical protein
VQGEPFEPFEKSLIDGELRHGGQLRPGPGRRSARCA